jgi:putative ABC transport system permease protein
LVLLIGAGLLVRSFWLLQQVSLGFNQDNILTMQMAIPGYKYPDPPRQAEYVKQILQRVSTLPGVEAAAISTSLPLNGTDTNSSFRIEGRPPASPQDKPLATITPVSPDFFKVMQVPQISGRAFTEQDTDKSPPVIIINEKMAKTYWPNENPVGKRMSVTLEGYKILHEIVGIVGNVRSTSLGEEPQAALYLPYAQIPFQLVFLTARTKTDPLSMASAVRNEVLAVDRDQPVYDIKSMQQVIRDSSAKQSFSMLLLTIFAVLALCLAMIGVYGVVASSITQRTREIGIRMALGAQQRDILKLFLKNGIFIVLIGIALGLAASFAVTRIMSSLLYQIKSTDPATFLLAILALLVISILAIYIPARRAAKLEPMVALREE